MTAENFFAGLAIASFVGLVVLLLWCDWPRKTKPPYHTTVPANRLPPRIEP